MFLTEGGGKNFPSEGGLKPGEALGGLKPEVSIALAIRYDIVEMAYFAYETPYLGATVGFPAALSQT